MEYGVSEYNIYIPIRNLSHIIKNGNRENRQPVEPKSVKQQSQQNKTEKNLWRAIVLGGYCPKGTSDGGLLSRGGGGGCGLLSCSHGSPVRYCHSLIHSKD